MPRNGGGGGGRVRKAQNSSVARGGAMGHLHPQA